MATEGAFGLGVASRHEYVPQAHPHPGAAPSNSTLRTLVPWIAARVADGGREAVFTVEADERYARVRRAHGATASMLETRLSTPMTALELAQALVRWAPSVAMTARLAETPAGVRVTLSMQAD